MAEPDAAEALAAVLTAEALRSVEHEGAVLRVGASVGHVLAPPHTPGATALRDADAAMYRHKRAVPQSEADRP